MAKQKYSDVILYSLASKTILLIYSCILILYQFDKQSFSTKKGFQDSFALLYEAMTQSTLQNPIPALFQESLNQEVVTKSYNRQMFWMSLIKTSVTLLSLIITAIIFGEQTSEQKVIDKKKDAIEAFKNKANKPEDGGISIMITDAITGCVEKMKLKCCRSFVCILYIVDIIVSIVCLITHVLFCTVSFTTTSRCTVVEARWLREKDNFECLSQCRNNATDANHFCKSSQFQQDLWVEGMILLMLFLLIEIQTQVQAMNEKQDSEFQAWQYIPVGTTEQAVSQKLPP